MEFKFNAVVSAVMLVAVIFAIAADCASVENPSKFVFLFNVFF